MVGSFVNNKIGIRRADGSLVATGIVFMCWQLIDIICEITCCGWQFCQLKNWLSRADGSLVATGIVFMCWQLLDIICEITCFGWQLCQ